MYGLLGRLELLQDELDQALIEQAALNRALQRLPDETIVYAFNLVRIPSTDSDAEADRLVKANRRAYERVRAAGGTLAQALRVGLGTVSRRQADLRPASRPYAGLRDVLNRCIVQSRQSIKRPTGAGSVMMPPDAGRAWPPSERKPMRC